jgi:hypothetical protein
MNKKGISILGTLVVLLFTTLLFAGNVTPNKINNNPLVGTWLLTQGGQTFLWTGHVDKTYICTYPSSGESIANGMYKKIGKNKYESTDWSFIFGKNGTEKYLCEANSIFTLVKDKKTNTVTMQGGKDKSLLINPKTGKVVKTLTGTFTGKELGIKDYK